MFDISWSELVLVGIVALIVIGPKELPGVLRAVGQWVGKIKRMASDFQGQFQEAMREAEVADLKKQFDEASNFASGIDNPLESAKNQIESTFKEATTMPSAEGGATAAAADIPPPPDIPSPEPPAPDQVGEVNEAGRVKRGDAA